LRKGGYTFKTRGVFEERLWNGSLDALFVLDTELPRAWENDSSLLKGMGRNVVAKGTQWLRQKDTNGRSWISPNIFVVGQKRFSQIRKYCLAIPLGIRPRHKQHFE